MGPLVSANSFFGTCNGIWFQNLTGVGLLESMKRTQDVGNAYLAYLFGTLGTEYGDS